MSVVWIDKRDSRPLSTQYTVDHVNQFIQVGKCDGYVKYEEAAVDR